MRSCCSRTQGLRPIDIRGPADIEGIGVLRNPVKAERR